MAIWIDVRTAEEYKQGHLEGAVNIPYDVIGEQIASVAEAKDAEIHLYCGSGRRAGMAKSTLEALGYTNVHNDGGYDELKAAGVKP